MGKRKKSSSKPQGPKKKDPLPSVFSCLFCNHEKSVTIRMDKKGGVGQLNCRVCGQAYQCNINYLSAPVDVYSEWIDACDDVQKGRVHDDHEEPTQGGNGDDYLDDLPEDPIAAHDARAEEGSGPGPVLADDDQGYE